MVRYILRTVYNSVLDIIILLGKLVTIPLATQTDFVAFQYKIRHFARLTIFGYILCTVFDEGSNSGDLSDRLANLILISEEQ